MAISLLIFVRAPGRLAPMSAALFLDGAVVAA